MASLYRSNNNNNNSTVKISSLMIICCFILLLSSAIVVDCFLEKDLCPEIIKAVEKKCRSLKQPFNSSLLFGACYTFRATLLGDVYCGKLSYSTTGPGESWSSSAVGEKADDVKHGADGVLGVGKGALDASIDAGTKIGIDSGEKKYR